VFQVSHDDYMYHINICGKLNQPGCEQSSLCRLQLNAAAADADIQKYTFNKMIRESGYLKLVYNRVSPSPSCGNNFLCILCIAGYYY